MLQQSLTPRPSPLAPHPSGFTLTEVMLVGGLMIFASSSPLAPFLYPLF